MSELSVTIEGVSAELIAAYAPSGMERGKAGAAAIAWAFGGGGACFAVARDRDRIVGLSGYIRNRGWFGAEEGMAWQAVDSFVALEARGRGVFTRLARAYDDHLRAEGGDLVWGFPNDNAAPTWFRKLGWHDHGQVPFLVKPLRAGYLLRRLGLPFDFALSLARDRGTEPLREIGAWADDLWCQVATGIGCGIVRDRAFLTHRLVEAPQAETYRIVADSDPERGALVATREAVKHGGRIAYVMEALGGGSSLRDLLASELGRLRDRGTELALAWCFPWSPNYRVLRGLGFLPLPQRLRPIRIWFGSRPLSTRASLADAPGRWYLSYLDSDTV